MAYQYVREPLLTDEYDQLSNACQTPLEKMTVWTLGEPASLSARHFRASGVFAVRCWRLTSPGRSLRGQRSMT